MLRISHRKGGCHRKGISLARHALQGCLKRLSVQWHQRIAVVIMSTGNHFYRNTRKRFGNTRFLHHRGIKADQKNAHCTAVAFHHGIGRQRGGNRHHGNVFRLQPLRQLGNCLGNRLHHANGEVTLGRDGFGRCNNTVPLGFNDGGVGVGAAGIHTDQVRG